MASNAKALSFLSGDLSLSGTEVSINVAGSVQSDSITGSTITMKNTGSTIVASDGTTAVLSESSGTVTIDVDVSTIGSATISGGSITGTEIDLKSSGTTIFASDGTTAVLSESGGVVTLTADEAVIEGSSSGNLVRITQTGTGNALVVEDSANPDSSPFVVDSSGNLMLGGAANSWSLLQAVQVDRGSISGYAGNSYLSHNFYASSGGSKYIASGGACQIRLVDDTIIFNRASSGSADATLSFSESMRIDSNGKLLISTSEQGIQIGQDIAAYTIKRDSSGLLNFRATQTNFNGYIFDTVDGERMRIDSSGNVGIGTDSPNYLCEIKSTGSSVLAISAASTSYDSVINFIHGTTVDGGITYDHNGAFASEAMKFRTGNNTTNMTLTGAGNLTITGSYSPFTASHIASIQNPENLRYGEIVEIESVTSNGFDVYYNARIANSEPKKILGIFREVIQEFNDNGDLINNSLINVLGDGHVLVNAENGNIKIGDAITLSSTAGVGKKATEPCYVIGIAQEDCIFEIESESALIAVQYGLQYFIPYNFIESQQSQIDALTAKTQEQNLTIASLISRIEALENA